MPRNNKRFNFTATIFIILFVTLAARIFYLQVFKKPEILATVKMFNHIKKVRGNICTSDGKVIASSLRNPQPPHKQRRIYFNREIFNHLCGFVNHENEGAAGCEYYYNKHLEGGKPQIIEVDATGKLLLSNDPAVLYAKGNDVYLTINSKIQEFLYNEIKRTLKNFRAENGYGLVIKPKTGEILASVFVRNEHGNLLFKNPLISSPFEPGSTFKIVTVSAALEEKLVKPADKFFCENGSFEFSGITIRDHEPYGWLAVDEIIQYSSNIGVSKLARLLGKKKLYYYARSFGFGNYTGINLPGETKGTLKRIDSWSDTSLQCISFGQEVSATPLQIAQAFCVIANNGILMGPRILSRIADPRGKVILRPETTTIRRVISEETAEKVKEMLFNVIQAGTGFPAKIPGWAICGKTGTGQKYDNTLGKYSEENFFASLGGFLPKDNPEFVIFIGFDNPKKNHYGGTVCGDAFRNIAKKLIDRYGIPPEAEGEETVNRRIGGRKNES